MKYIFVAGAPGSKWSSVAKNIYYSDSIDRSDYSQERTYYHDANGKRDLMHLGAYWDPGMEFGAFFDDIENYTKEQCEAEFNRPFAADATGVRIIKSHVFSNHLDFLKQQWPECPVVLVYRGNDTCLGWWVKCGHFDISYPDYAEYYKNLREMGSIIEKQNDGIQQGAWKYPRREARTNQELARILNIAQPPEQYYQDYIQSDIRIQVI